MSDNDFTVVVSKKEKKQLKQQQYQQQRQYQQRQYQQRQRPPEKSREQLVREYLENWRYEYSGRKLTGLTLGADIVLEKLFLSRPDLITHEFIWDQLRIPYYDGISSDRVDRVEYETRYIQIGSYPLCSLDIVQDLQKLQKGDVENLKRKIRSFEDLAERYHDESDYDYQEYIKEYYAEHSEKLRQFADELILNS